MVEKDEHEIISQPFNDLPWPQLGEKGTSYNCLCAMYGRRSISLFDLAWIYFQSGDDKNFNFYIGFQTVQFDEALKKIDIISASEETVQFDEAAKGIDVISASEETLRFDKAPKEDDVTSAAEETVRFDEVPREIDVIPASEETVQFDEAPKENDLISAADETVPFVEAPTENEVTTASEEKLQFDDDTLRGEKTTSFLLSITKCRRRRNEKVHLVRPRAHEYGNSWNPTFFNPDSCKRDLGTLWRAVSKGKVRSQWADLLVPCVRKADSCGRGLN